MTFAISSVYTGFFSLEYNQPHTLRFNFTDFPRETTDVKVTLSRFAFDRDRSRFLPEASRNFSFSFLEISQSRTPSHSSQLFTFRSSRSCSISAHKLPSFLPAISGHSPGVSSTVDLVRLLPENPRRVRFFTDDLSRRSLSFFFTIFLPPPFHASLSTLSPRCYQQVIPHKRKQSTSTPYDHPRCRVAVSHAAQRYTPPHSVVIVA